VILRFYKANEALEVLAYAVQLPTAVKGEGRGFSRQSLVVWALTHSLWALCGGANS